MGALNLALAALGEGAEPKPYRLGPNGGNIDNPVYHPQNRNAALNANIIETPDGQKIVGLHDPRERDSARQGIECEKPWHRMAAHMINRRFTNAEVADAAEVSVDSVSTLRAQRWFNELCAVLAEDKGSAIKARLDGYALEAVEEIHAIATDLRVDEDGKPLTPTRVRLAAHTTLLEHSQGRPTQKVLSVSATTSFSSEREEYDACIAELKAIAPTLLANPPEQNQSNNAE